MAAAEANPDTLAESLDSGAAVPFVKGGGKTYHWYTFSSSQWYVLPPPLTPWADELADGLQVGAQITFDAVVTRYVKGYTGDDPVRQAARPRELDYGLEKIQAVRGHGHGGPG